MRNILKAFMGDSSDGYPGVKGIGPKTALQLIQNHGSIDGVIAALSTLKPGQRTKISENEEMLRLSHKLAKIHCEAEIEADLESLRLTEYTPTLFNTIETSGYRLIAKHARSIY